MKAPLRTARAVGEAILDAPQRPMDDTASKMLLQLIVRGEQGAGKTKLASVIHAALTERGFKSVLLDDEETIDNLPQLEIDAVYIQTEQEGPKMPRVHKVEHARKSRPEIGVAVGDSYYYWKRRKGPLQFSKTYPKRSQLTGSSFLATIYDIEDDIAKLVASDALPDDRDDIVQRLEDLKSETESSLENMPEALQQGDTGQMLQARIDGLDEAISSFSDIDFSDIPENEDELAEFWDDKLAEMQDVVINYE